MSDTVSVHMNRTWTHRGIEHYRTHVNVPKYIRDVMNLSDDSTVFLSSRSASSLFMLRSRKYADDEETRLLEYVTRRYRDRKYTALRLTIPKRLADRLKLKKRSKAEFTYTGSSCIISFKNPV